MGKKVCEKNEVLAGAKPAPLLEDSDGLPLGGSDSPVPSPIALAGAVACGARVTVLRLSPTGPPRMELG